MEADNQAEMRRAHLTSGETRVLFDGHPALFNNAYLHYHLGRR